jgi:serine/threonine-protein kinase
MIVGLVQPGRMADIYQKPIKGTGDAEALFKSDKWKDPLSSSPDDFLLFDVAGRNSELWMLPLKGKQKPVPLLQGGSSYRGGHFSPDGHWVAYISDESGHPEVYVGSFSPEGLSNPQRVSANGGNSVRWGYDGKLYYIDLDKKLMAVKLTLGSAFQAGVPMSLFRAPGISYSPSPDGKFLFLVPQAQEEVPLTVVLNWQAGLKK